MSARLVWSDGSPYPQLATRATTARSWGRCVLSTPDNPHEGELDHDGFCARHLAQVYRDPLVIRRRRRLTREWLRHWWQQHCLIISTLVLLVAWVLLVWGAWGLVVRHAGGDGMVTNPQPSELIQDQPSSVEIIRNAKGDYQWAIKVYCEVGEEEWACRRAWDVDQMLRDRYLPSQNEIQP